MNVSQVDRATDSVTINVSGITKGDRQTYVWIPHTILNSDEGGWFTLKKAKTNGYIYDYYAADLNSNNGDITVQMTGRYCRQQKTVGLRVKNGINIDTTSETLYDYIDIYTVLDFEYENSFPKVAGSDIDITIADMKALNFFGRDMDMWFSNGEGLHYPLDDVVSGDYIYADYLWYPANNILNAAINCPDLYGSNYSKVYNYASNIVNNCVSGADFKAQYFNDILYAIRNFNLSI